MSDIFFGFINETLFKHASTVYMMYDGNNEITELGDKTLVVFINVNEVIRILHIAAHRALKSCYAYTMKNEEHVIISKSEEGALVNWNASCVYITNNM